MEHGSYHGMPFSKNSDWNCIRCGSEICLYRKGNEIMACSWDMPVFKSRVSGT